MPATTNTSTGAASTIRSPSATSATTPMAANVSCWLRSRPRGTCGVSASLKAREAYGRGLPPVPAEGRIRPFRGAYEAPRKETAQELRKQRDPVQRRGRHRRVGCEVVVQGVQVDRARDQVGAGGEAGEVVSARGQEAVLGDAVAGGRIDRHAVDRDVRDLVTDGCARAPGVGQGARRRQDPVLARLRVVELLLEDGVELRTGEGHRVDVVRERLNREGLAVGHDAVAFGAAL